MKYLILAFKSRNNLYAINKTLLRNGLNTAIVNTPRNISVSCGLSIKVDFKSLDICKTIMSRLRVDDFLGIYIVERIDKHEQVTKVY